MTVSTRATFERQLAGLRDDVLILGSMVDKAIDRSVEALKRRDLNESQLIISDDMKINRKRFEIEEKCLLLLATQQPMASDLRVIAAVMHIITDLERMGDHAEGIAKINMMMGDEPLLKPLIDIPEMADKARDMLRRSLDAFVAGTPRRRSALAQEDDEVDQLYDRVYQDLLGFMIKDPAPSPGPPICCGSPTTWSGSPTGSPTSASGWSSWSPAGWRRSTSPSTRG